ncbi:MAG: hypothetical protein Q8R92_09000 [Deltaproteobacteria bacterium]|nr:hypothetical protein [Deltaproteobacteria bacterium]
MDASTFGGRIRGGARRIPALRVVAAILALLPAVFILLGAERASAGPITQAAWARLLVDAMGLSEAVDPSGQDDAALMEFLSGTPAPAIRVWAASAKPFPAEAQSVPADGGDGKAGVRAGNETASGRYLVRIPQPGIYALRFTGAGELQRWRMDENEVRLGRPSGTMESLGAEKEKGDLLGYFLLSAGDHEVTVEIPLGGALGRFELLRQPFPHVLPPGGWHPGEALTFGVKAVTMVQAMQLEHELPDISKWRVQREGERYDADPLPGQQTNEGTRDKPSEGALVKGAGSGSRMLYRVEVPQPGTYTLLARVTGAGGGRLLLNDSVERAWRAPDPSDRLVWNDLATLPLGGGAQGLDVRLDAGAGLDVLRLIYRDPSPEASLMLLEDLGFHESDPEAVVSMAAAMDNTENARFQERVNTLVAGFYTQPGAGIGPGSGPFPGTSPGLVYPTAPETSISP